MDYIGELALSVLVNSLAENMPFKKAAMYIPDGRREYEPDTKQDYFAPVGMGIFFLCSMLLIHEPQLPSTGGIYTSDT